MRFSLLKPLFGVILLCTMMVSAAVAEPVIIDSTKNKPIPSQLEKALNQMAAMPGFSCEFLQVVYFSDGAEQRYSGTLSISRPGRFHWLYRHPYEQLYVSNGSGVWHYEADLMQAERLESLDGVDPIAMKLLDGRVSQKDVELLSFEKVGRDTTAYKIRISQSQELLLALTAAGELRWIESEDVLGNRNRILFMSIEKTARPNDYFNFVPPEGVDVIKMAGPLVEPVSNFKRVE